MDIGLREVFIIIAIAIICGIFFDAYRRVRDSRRSQFGFKLDDALPPSDDLVSTELPSGKARIVGQTHEVTAPFKASLVDADPANPDAAFAPPADGQAASADYLAARRNTKPAQAAAEHTSQSNERLDPSHGGAQVSEPETIEAPNPEVLVINLIANNQQVFHGEKLMQTLLALGLRFGDMDIFHRFERPEEKKGRLFSLANLVEPGYFDLNSMASFQTPGVCLFLSLPGPTRSLYAFDLMVDTARKLVHNLGADMLDDQQNPVTSQTIEQYRHRVMEFERKQKVTRRVEPAPELA